MVADERKTPKSKDIVVEEKQQNPGGRADLLKMAENGVPIENVYSARKRSAPSDGKLQSV